MDFSKRAVKLSDDQELAIELLRSGRNVFLTGAAGTGKSFLLREFLRERESKTFPVLASTGLAAILVGGRTFHSFFGLGILEGGRDATVERALRNSRVTRRLKKIEGFVVDEVSMLSGSTLSAAEEIIRRARDSSRPWGGVQVIAVGDFSQLPPISMYQRQREWAFRDPVWLRSDFDVAYLQEILRTKDQEFTEVLNDVRLGHVSTRVRDFLNSRLRKEDQDFVGTRLFGKKVDVDRYNRGRLDQLPGNLTCFETEFHGNDRQVEQFRKNSPIPDQIFLKEDALVMLRQNDPRHRWVNGSLGHVREILDDRIVIELLKGREIEIERADFSLLDAEGKPQVLARNFPINLAYAVTIHKAQGSTLDYVLADLRSLWECGQAYVAMSRVRSGSGLYLEGWSPRSIFADREVAQFYQRIQAQAQQSRVSNTNLPTLMPDSISQ